MGKDDHVMDSRISTTWETQRKEGEELGPRVCLVYSVVV
jgi:hypothetical protein